MQDGGCEDELGGERMIDALSGAQQESKPTLPHAKRLLDKEPRGRVAEVEPGLFGLMGTRVVVGVEEESVIQSWRGIKKTGIMRSDRFLSPPPGTRCFS